VPYLRVAPEQLKEVPMWTRKNPDVPKLDMSETGARNLQENPSPKAGPFPWATIQKNKDVTLPAGSSADPATSWVGYGLHVKGEISGDEDLLIDGSVEGLVQLGDRNVTVGTTAEVMADITAGEVVIYGKVKGNVQASGRVEIKKEGSVTGDLRTPQILIEDGAYFKGSIEIGKSTETQAQKNVFPPAA